MEVNKSATREPNPIFPLTLKRTFLKSSETDSMTRSARQQSMLFSSDHVSSFCEGDSALEVVTSAAHGRGDGGEVIQDRSTHGVQDRCRTVCLYLAMVRLVK
jgi:hypothetical protein